LTKQQSKAGETMDMLWGNSTYAEVYE